MNGMMDTGQAIRQSMRDGRMRMEKVRAKKQRQGWRVKATTTGAHKTESVSSAIQMNEQQSAVATLHFAIPTL